MTKVVRRQTQTDLLITEPNQQFKNSTEETLPLKGTGLILFLFFGRCIQPSLQDTDASWLIQTIPENSKGEEAPQLTLELLVQTFAEHWPRLTKKDQTGKNQK